MHSLSQDKNWLMKYSVFSVVTTFAWSIRPAVTFFALCDALGRWTDAGADEFINFLLKLCIKFSVDKNFHKFWSATDWFRALASRSKSSSNSRHLILKYNLKECIKTSDPLFRVHNIDSNNSLDARQWNNTCDQCSLKHELPDCRSTVPHSNAQLALLRCTDLRGSAQLVLDHWCLVNIKFHVHMPFVRLEFVTEL